MDFNELFEKDKKRHKIAYEGMMLEVAKEQEDGWCPLKWLNFRAIQDDLIRGEEKNEYCIFY